MLRLIITLFLFFSFVLCGFAIDSSDRAHSEDDKFKITMREAMNMALVGNIELQEQRKNLGVSQNDIKIANALKNPQAQSNLLLGRSGKGNASQVGVAVPVELFKRGARKKSAEAGLMYTENKIKDYEFKLKLRIRTSYFNLLIAKSEMKIMQERKELLEDLYEIAQNKPKDSSHYQTELLQADMRLKKQLIQVNKSKANVRTAQYNFNRVLNLENNLTLYDTVEDSLFDKTFNLNIELPSYEVLENAAFVNRYDIKMAEAKILKAQRDITVATRKKVPDAYFGGGYAFSHDGTTGAYVGAGFDVPVLYRYLPEIKNAKLNYEKAQLEYNSIINITKNIIHTNHDKFIIAKENVEHYEDILEESREVLKLSKQRYKKGEATLTSLIIVEHSHQELLNEYIKALGTYYNSYIALLQEIGVDSFTQLNASENVNL